MKQYAIEVCNKYAYFIGGMTVVPSIYFMTGRLFSAVAGYSIGYATMLLIEKFTKI